ncbi:5'-3' exonuclease [Smaragdicoccus niigatensis]|uniref:5'-3' exonuclease n=1 Tax=Smaragdicoccus niigatensis TaxID=359359 RepID=UPI000362365A|nr:5'-3' exonuclease [Smaragdicoccus niigatensis]
MTGRLLLLDGASLWFRAFFAVPDSIRDSEGRPVNAVRGFTDMVAALVDRHRPTRLVVCLDLDWRPQWRVDLVPTYKTHRLAAAPSFPGEEEVPDDLTPQVDKIMAVLAAAGIATGGAKGFEADDVLGTLATQESVDEVVVVSGDRDLLQLVADEPNPIRVYYVGRGLAKAELYDPAMVAERYGVPADRAGEGYAELATLRGDSSDGLPGVAGVGEKTASTLLLRYGSLDALRRAVDDPASGLAKGMRAKLEAGAEYLDRATPVVRVARDAEVIMSKTDELPATPADEVALKDLGTKYNAENAVARLIAAMAGQQS